MPALYFKALRFIFSLIMSALLAWAIAAIFDANTGQVFLILALGFPVVVWLERLKNIPAHLAAAAILNKQLTADIKRGLKRLPIKTADEWNDFQSFYESDQEIAQYRISDPKVFAVAIQSEFAALKNAGLIVSTLHSHWIMTQAIEQMWEEAVDANVKQEENL